MHTTIVRLEIVSDQTPEELETGTLEEVIERLEADIPNSSVRLISATEK
jgi:hypothetical protein